MVINLFRREVKSECNESFKNQEENLFKRIIFSVKIIIVQRCVYVILFFKSTFPLVLLVFM